MAIKYLKSDQEFDEAVNQTLCVVDFYADWCGPCQALGPILDALSDDVDFPIYKVNVDELTQKASDYQIMSIPSLIIFKNGEVIDKHVGVMQRDEIITWVNSKK